MEHEERSVPEHHPSDTPEFVQECLRYKHAIEDQLDDWCELSKSTHPAARMGNMASFIVNNCTPKPSPAVSTNTNPFEVGLTPNELARLKQKQEQHKLIAEIAQNNEYDPVDSLEIDANETPVEELFAHVQFFTKNPNSPQVTKDALLYLQRIYTAETLISERIKHIVRPSPQD